MRIKHYDHNIDHNTGNYMIFFKRKISVIRKKKRRQYIGYKRSVVGIKPPKYKVTLPLTGELHLLPVDLWLSL